MNRKWIFLASLAWTLSTAGTLMAEGVFLHGTSPRSIGRGGTNIAYADNGSILLDNPAGAVNIEGEQLLDLGVDVMITDFHYSDLSNPSAEDSTGIPLPQIALIRRTADGRFAYGLGVFAPAGFSERFDLQGPWPLVGTREYWSFGSLAKVLPTVAYRVDDQLTVGATLGVAISHDELKGPYFLQGPSALAGLPMMLSLRGTGAALCWSTGLQYELTDATTLGVTYQSESRFALHGPTNVDVPLLGGCRYDTETMMTWPQSVGVGMRHELCPHRIVSTDLVWYNWSAAYDSLGVHLTNPSRPLFPELYEEFPLHWHDAVSVRVGYEQVLGEGRTIRCGYVYAQNPIPNSTLTPFIQGILEHSFSVGYGWLWNGWEADVAYMFSFSGQQTVDKSDFVGGDFDHSENEARTHCVAFSLMRRY